MLSDSRCHTTLPCTDLERARGFYADKLSLTPIEKAPGGLIYEVAGGTRFILYPAAAGSNGQHTQLGFTTDDIEREVSGLRDRGVHLEEYDYPNLKTVNGIADTPAGRAAWFKDSEGNMIGMIQFR